MSSVDDASSIAAITKAEPLEEDDFSDFDQDLDGQQSLQGAAQTQKRKGGRKPIYATSEERKQRNRQAQAAFRERRTEYIKQLEGTIKHHEDNLQSLQQSHRSAADECLMLRYKNSLLERILLEKGVDVQAELRVKTEGSSVLSHPANTCPSAVQRAVMNRHNQNRRAQTGVPSKSSVRPAPNPAAQTPRSHTIKSPTVTSHTANSRSPVGSAGLSDEVLTAHSSSNLQSRSNSQPLQGIPKQMPNMPNSRQGLSNPSDGNHMVTSPHNGYYPPSYQAHLDELSALKFPSGNARGADVNPDQEYAQGDGTSDGDPSDTSNGRNHNSTHSNYPADYSLQLLASSNAMPLGIHGNTPIQQMQHMQQMHQHQEQQQQQQRQRQVHQSSHTHAGNITVPPPRPSPQSVTTGQQVIDNSDAMFNVLAPNFDPYDPSLDADPFGLTASMHFPTQFSYQGGPLRR